MVESASTFYWVYSTLRKRNYVVLANAAKTKAIVLPKIKTDRLDSLTPANLLRDGYIAERYIPLKQIMELKDLVSYMANLARVRINLRNSNNAYLLMNSVKTGEGVRPFTVKFIQELEKIEAPSFQG